MIADIDKDGMIDIFTNSTDRDILLGDETIDFNEFLSMMTAKMSERGDDYYILPYYPCFVYLSTSHVFKTTYLSISTSFGCSLVYKYI